MSHRWTFETMGPGAQTWTVPINPNQGGTPPEETGVVTEAPVHPEGTPQVFIGPDVVSPTQTSGVMLTLEHLHLLQDLRRRRRPLKLTDDLGRVMIILITRLDPQRRYSATYFGRHDYTLTYLVLQELDRGDT